VRHKGDQRKRDETRYIPYDSDWAAVGRPDNRHRIFKSPPRWRARPRV